ncbi:PQQ-binding-like beta-propeller repeat protein [Mycobacterium sp. 141]|uniref:outer membrane protein assembly factor BamB family protein n=1 Tax=Mycobacterium sp. 141 TaxID=1120797 RepID=UPI00047706A8|nr:PQQ-binding-like beta-propeller repeat protein [Mycobacterium sp. 141]
MARFNPPPAWPVDPDFTPGPDWQPDPAWPAAPPGWRFWVEDTAAAGHEPGVEKGAARPPRIERMRAHESESIEQVWLPIAAPAHAAAEPEPQTDAAAPSKPRPPSRRTAIVLGAAALVAVVVAASVAAVAWWTGDNPEHARPDKMLPGTYPTQPQPAWTVRAASLVAGDEPAIATPVYGVAYYGSPGAIVIGDHVLFHAVAKESNGTGALLISLDLADGSVEWSVPAGLNDGCSRTPLGDTLPCTVSGNDQSRIQFIDLKSGGVVSTAALPFNVGMLAADGDDLYTAGYKNPDGLTVARGTRDDPTGDWTTTVAENACSGYGGGDGLDIHLRDGLVWGYQGGGANFVLKTDDGSSAIGDEVTNASVVEGPAIVALKCRRNVNMSDWTTGVYDGDGRSLFTVDAAVSRPSLSVARGGRPPLLTNEGDGLDPNTGEKLWHVAEPGYGPAVVGNVLIAADDGLSAYDMRSGATLWRSSAASSADTAVTDGANLLIPEDDAGVTALSVADGSRQWSGTVGVGRDRPVLYATERGLLVVTSQGVSLLPPTGPEVPVPDIRGPQADGDDGTKLVTKCGRPPEFVPQAIRADSGALVITVKIVAHCPGGDVLSASRTRIAVTSNGQNVASAVFDLSAKPITIAPAAGGSAHDPNVTHDFLFPVGTFWRLPVSTREAPGDGASSRGAVDLDASTLLIDCEQDGSVAGTTAAAVRSGSGSSTATGPGRPASGDDESASYDALRAIANSDRPFVVGQLADRWVPQLSSKRPGLVADGIIWQNAETLREHLDLRLKYPEVRLLWTGDWSTFSAPDFWVTIAGVTFPDAGGALGWCTGHGLDRDHCYAKLVSTTHPIDGSTAFNP